MLAQTRANHLHQTDIQQCRQGKILALFGILTGQLLQMKRERGAKDGVAVCGGQSVISPGRS